MSKNNLGMVTLAVVGLVLTGCHEKSSAPDLRELPTARVSVVTVASRETPRFQLLPGTVVARTKATLESKITGRILELNAELGRSVKAGDTLVRIHAPEISAQVEQAAAALELAAKNEARTAKLFGKQAATQAEFDAARSRLMQANAALAEARSMNAYAIVQAPLAGVVSGKFAEVGDLSTPGRPILEIEDPTGKQFQANVSESLINQISVGDKQRIRFPDVEMPVEATLSEINPSGSPSTRTWLTKWDLPDEIHLRSGAYGQVAIPGGRSDTIRVPVAAVILRGQLEQVFVAEDGRAVLRLVKTGPRDGEAVEILSGLMPGDQLITGHPDDLRDGQRVGF